MLCGFCGQAGGVPISLLENPEEIRKLWPSMPEDFHIHGYCKMRVQNILAAARRDWEKEKDARSGVL